MMLLLQKAARSHVRAGIGAAVPRMLSTLPPGGFEGAPPTIPVHDVTAAVEGSAKPPVVPPARVPRQDISTQILAFKHEGDPHGATAVPLYQTATFALPPEEPAQYDYTRSGNPTRRALENTIARIENANDAFVFTTGMAALNAVVRTCTQPGDRIVATRDLYGGMHRLLTHVSTQNGLAVEYADLSDRANVERAIRPGTKLVCVESVTNPLMTVADIRLISEMARAVGALVCVDNTFLSPLLLKPIDLGADFVVHSATKFLNGHSDTMAGSVAVASFLNAKRIAFLQNAEGAGLAPFDSWLVLRGLKTLHIRQKESQRNAEILCDFLRAHPAIECVYYNHPRDTSHSDQARIHYSQASGGGSVLSFLPRGNSLKLSKLILEKTAIFKKTVSFGSVHSLLELPLAHSHASIPRERHTFPESLVRMSLGIEEPNDLISDLAQAIDSATSELGATPGNPFSAPASLRIAEPPLGSPLPPSEIRHACGVAMPAWSDVVGYEEGDPSIVAKLTTGYPRFLFPPPVRELIKSLPEHLGLQEDRGVLPVPSARTALRLQSFLLGVLDATGSKESSPNEAHASQIIQVHDLASHGAFAVSFPVNLAPAAKSFWQHTGETVSSRFAEVILAEIKTLGISLFQDGFAYPELPSSGDASIHTQLQRRIAQLAANVDPNNVYLFPTGMGAISFAQRILQSAYRSARASAGHRKFVVFGFPYLDTLKMLQHPQLSPGAHFVPCGSIAKLEEILRKESILGLFCEYPSNPLLKTAPLGHIRELADKYQFPVVVDDSISSFYNVSPLGKYGADILVSSLTKAFSGKCNVMGGSMILSPESKFFRALKARCISEYENTLYRADAETLLFNSIDMESRQERINTNAEALADFLRLHPAVESVFYPKFVTPELYRRFARHQQGGGWGGLLSVVLKKKDLAPRVYDALKVAKGPGFGTNFTLVCPYTLLAHYHEQDFARSHGVDPSLLRIWVGTEPFDQIIAAFKRAFDLGQ